MCIPGLLSSLAAEFPSSNQETNGQKPICILLGIEAHICITQTALDLVAAGYKVYVLADGVSSCNREEVPIALRRLAGEGVVVSSSESVLYEIMGDAGVGEFRDVAGLVRGGKERSREVLGGLCKI